MEAVKDIFEGFEDLFSDLENSTNNEIKQEKGVTAKPVPSKENITIENTGNATLVSNAQTKLNMIKKEMNDLIVERDAVIDCMLYALVSGQSLLLLGLPGTGKSYISYELCSRIENANYFQWMLNKTSDPSEILGPQSIKAMENDKYLRITTGKLPEAHIAFIDEVKWPPCTVMCM